MFFGRWTMIMIMVVFGLVSMGMSVIVGGFSRVAM